MKQIVWKGGRTPTTIQSMKKKERLRMKKRKHKEVFSDGVWN